MSVSFFGDYDTTETVKIPFNTFDSNDPTASVTITNLVAGDIEIHKDGGTTQRSSDSGVTISIDFDSITGNHIASIDLSDNTDAGFYAAGSRYQVRIEGTTVDAGTINAWIGAFSVGCTLRPTTDGRTLDVTATGAAGIDWGNVENKTTANDLTQTDIQLCDTVTTNTDLVSASAVTTDMDANSTELAKIGTIPALDGGAQTIGAAIAKLADDNGGATYNAGEDSLNKIRDDRTLAAADYVVVGDTIAGVTTVATTTDVTNDVGITQAGADKAWGTAARVLTAGTNLNDIAATDVWDLASALTLDFGTLVERVYQFFNNELKIVDATGVATLRNLADSADMATWTITDDDTNTDRTAISWV